MTAGRNGHIHFLAQKGEMVVLEAILLYPCTLNYFYVYSCQIDRKNTLYKGNKNISFIYIQQCGCLPSHQIMRHFKSCTKIVKYYKLSILFSLTIYKDLRISKYTILFIKRFLCHKYFMQFAFLLKYTVTVSFRTST